MIIEETMPPDGREHFWRRKNSTLFSEQNKTTGKNATTFSVSNLTIYTNNNNSFLAIPNNNIMTFGLLSSIGTSIEVPKTRGREHAQVVCTRKKKAPTLLDVGASG